MVGDHFKPGATRPSSQFGSPVQFAFPDTNERRSPGVGHCVPSSAPGVDCARRTESIAFAASSPCACSPLDSPRTPRRPLRSSLRAGNDPHNLGWSFGSLRYSREILARLSRASFGSRRPGVGDPVGLQYPPSYLAPVPHCRARETISRARVVYQCRPCPILHPPLQVTPALMPCSALSPTLWPFGPLPLAASRRETNLANALTP